MNIFAFRNVAQNERMLFVFVDVFDAICAEHGISPTRVLADLGSNRSAYSRWKNEGGEPSNPMKKKIADYFGITVKQLMSGETEKASSEKEEADTELIGLLEAVRRRPDLKMLFSLSKNATPEDVRKTIKILEALKGDDGTGDY